MRESVIGLIISLYCKTHCYSDFVPCSRGFLPKGFPRKILSLFYFMSLIVCCCWLLVYLSYFSIWSGIGVCLQSVRQNYSLKAFVTIPNIWYQSTLGFSIGVIKAWVCLNLSLYSWSYICRVEWRRLWNFRSWMIIIGL